MRERMRSGVFDERGRLRQRSRSRSRSRSRINRFVSLHSVGERFDKQGSYTKSYYRRSPSPIKSDDVAYLFGRTLSPPSMLRRGDYYKSSNVASTLSPIQHVERSYLEIENGNNMVLQNQIPVRSPSRLSDYEYFPEPYDRRADEHRKISDRRLGNSRYEDDIVDKGKDVASNVETKRVSRGYSHHLVEQGSESRRVEDNQVNHGGPSPSSARKYEDLGVYDAISNNHPVRPYFHPSRNQNMTRNIWNSDRYDSDTNRYEHLPKSKEISDERTFYKPDFERDISFRNRTASFRTSPSIKGTDCKKGNTLKQRLNIKNNWDCDSIMSKNIEPNSKEHLKNIDEEWVIEKPTPVFFQEPKTIDTKGAKSYPNASIDNISLSLSRAYVPQRIDFGVSYIHDQAIKKNKTPKDIKKRLGGRASVKTRLGPLRNVKQRLGPIPIILKPQRSLPPKILPMKEKPSHDSVTELPEDSENFRLMTNNAFLKFSKSLNENFETRRKFMEERHSGSFPCSVCISSPEFVGAVSLAQHAYHSCKTGMRSEHLGFHRALCVLMGWKTAEGSGPWAVQKLSRPEAELVQNDLLIWPPVVFIHGNVGVNAKEVRDALQGKGIGEYLMCLSERKGPNCCLFVAAFKGTLPGYGEAVKLASYFEKAEHGRANLLQLSGGAKADSDMSDLGNEESVRIPTRLYGYLGICTDLDKLDSDMRKKCFLKSRRDVESYAG